MTDVSAAESLARAERGRPRDASLDAAIRAAVREILATKGYERLSVSEVTRTCGVHVRTVTRRWATKASLVAAAVFDGDRPLYAGEGAPKVPTGNLRADLRAVIRSNLEFLSDPAVRAALPALWAAMAVDAEVAARVLNREREWQQVIDAILRRALTAGDAPARVLTRGWLVPLVLGGTTSFVTSMPEVAPDHDLLEGLADFVAAALLGDA